MMTREDIRRLPKVELHCHLDGSVSTALIERLAAELYGAKEEAKAAAKGAGVSPSCQSLAEYLTCFSHILPLLQTAESLTEGAFDVVRQAAGENVIYLELRFAPALHGRLGLSQREACLAVLRGLERAETAFGVKSTAILSMMRGGRREENLKTLSCAGELREYGVGGIDLAGNESAYPAAAFKEFFDQARAAHIPFTIHGGECRDPEQVNAAIQMGAVRIGHGLAIADHEEIKALCRKEKICLEMCPTSNLQTKAVESLLEYPFERFRKDGIAVTINTDNRTVSNTTLTKEWELLDKTFPAISEQTILETAAAGIRAAFLPGGEKQKLLDELHRCFDAAAGIRSE